MAGHSQFKNIQHRKNAQDRRRAKLFTKILREVALAARDGGADPVHNPKIRNALATARALNLPKDRIEKAIKQTDSAEDMQNYHDITYECFIPGGIAVIVKVLTDNRNRTTAEVRSAFNRHGGSLGETNSVSFMFDYLGIIHYDVAGISESEILETAVEVGAHDTTTEDEEHIVYTDPQDFNAVLNGLAEKFGHATEAYLGWRPHNPIFVKDEEQAASIDKLLESLEAIDEVQRTFTNYRS